MYSLLEYIPLILTDDMSLDTLWLTLQKLITKKGIKENMFKIVAYVEDSLIASFNKLFNPI